MHTPAAGCIMLGYISARGFCYDRVLLLSFLGLVVPNFILLVLTHAYPVCLLLCMLHWLLVLVVVGGPRPPALPLLLPAALLPLID